MQVIMMNPGRQVLKNTINGGSPGIIESFETGTNSNLYLDPNQTGASPSASYSDGIQSITKTIATNDDIIITCNIPYNIALSFGNIMVKLSGGVPFLWMTFPQLWVKHALDELKHNAGDVFQIPFIVRYPSIGSKLDLTNLSDYYAQAPVSTNIQSMTNIYQSICKQQQIDNSDRTFNGGRPIYATIAKKRYWGVPFTRSMDDLTGWKIDGGVAGDGYIYNP